MKSSKLPVHEAEYGLIELNPLKLYDCLIPRLNEQKLLPIAKFSAQHQENFVAIAKAKASEVLLVSGRPIDYLIFI